MQRSAPSPLDDSGAGPNIYNHLNSLLEGMSILQNQMVALTANNKALQLILECRLVEMENRLKDARADDLAVLIAHISEAAKSAAVAAGAPSAAGPGSESRRSFHAAT
eukprot:CAMPEP_0172179944 /NCGR_PEP_ID=MMETSP1050-20130122/16916_1 /TAXON_ID=233186 /ORGANISM="Cryptomonas curvata, Strain CCAP979/52" /LENGTH=107 /DNA_ID=CAMNT_0012852917 /DNA_START=162 /DNA_END=482 /DNA_ORIENTATION=-